MRPHSVAGARHIGIRPLLAVMALLLLAGCTSTDADLTALASDPPTVPTDANEEPIAAEPTVEAAATGDAQRWADATCATATRWQQTVSDAVADVPGQLASSTSLGDANTAVGGSLTGVVDASQTASDELAATELPDTENRDALQREINTVSRAITDVGATIDDARSTGQNVLQFAVSVQDAITAAQDNGAQVTSAFQRIGRLDLGPEVETALRSNPDCVTLQG